MPRTWVSFEYVRVDRSHMLAINLRYTQRQIAWTKTPKLHGRAFISFAGTNGTDSHGREDGSRKPGYNNNLMWCDHDDKFSSGELLRASFFWSTVLAHSQAKSQPKPNVPVSMKSTFREMMKISNVTTRILKLSPGLRVCVKIRPSLITANTLQ